MTFRKHIQPIFRKILKITSIKNNQSKVKNFRHSSKLFRYQFMCQHSTTNYPSTDKENSKNMNHPHPTQPGLHFSPPNANVANVKNPQDVPNQTTTPQGGNFTTLLIPNNCLGLPNIQWTQFGVPTVPNCQLQLPNVPNVLSSYVCNPQSQCLVPYVCSPAVTQCCNSSHDQTFPKPMVIDQPSSGNCTCGVDQNRGFYERDLTPCSNAECPLALRLQTLASQLLSINGVISGTISRLICKKLPNSNIHSSEDQVC